MVISELALVVLPEFVPRPGREGGGGTGPDPTWAVFKHFLSDSEERVESEDPENGSSPRHAGS